MSLPLTTSGYGLGPEDGDPLWFNGARVVVKTTVYQTEGRYAALEVWGRKGFAAPLHIHDNEDEFFIVMSGEVRVRHGDEIIEAVPGSLVYGPRGVPHSFHVDSEEAKILLLFGPGGVERFFREGGKAAGSSGLPPVGEEFLDREALMAIGARYHQQFVGPPMAPKDSH